MVKNTNGLLILAALLCLVAKADEFNPARQYPGDIGSDERDPRVLVKFRGNSDAILSAGAAAMPSILSARASISVGDARPVLRARNLYAMRLDPAPSTEALAEKLARLRADPAVEYAELDRRRYLHYVPGDPLYPAQWYLQNRSDAPSSIDAEDAWDRTLGNPGVVIGVFDTGALYDHPDLLAARMGGRLLDGYDFVSDADVANDGDGRDADASDPAIG